MLSSAKELMPRHIFAKCVMIHLHMNGVKHAVSRRVYSFANVIKNNGN